MSRAGGIGLGMVTSLVVFAAAVSGAEPELHWAQWRGPHGTGEAAADADPPVTWSPDSNIAWRAEVPGFGNATPIIVGDLVLVQTAIETELRDAAAHAGSVDERPSRPQQAQRQRERRGGPPGGRGRRGGGRGQAQQGEQPDYAFSVIAYDRHSGDVRWRTKVHQQAPTTGIRPGHATYASNSPVSDGRYVWAYFGSYGLHCVDMEGEHVWSKQFEPMSKRNGFGEGSSPTVYGDTLVVVRDHEGDSSIIALDAATGDELWTQPRDEISSWATSLALEVNGRPQVIVPATGACRAYDLETGEVVWSGPGLTTNAIPSPVYADGMVYLMSGFRGEALQAIRIADARGEFNDSSDAVAWTYHQDTPYVPSPLLYEGVLYFLRSNSGILTALDAETGQPLYETHRLELSTVYASPVAAAGRIYITDRGGKTVVLRPGPEPEVLAVNTLEDEVDASPVIAGDQLFLRGGRYLYCIEEGAE